MLVPTQLVWVAREPFGSTCALPPIPCCTSRLLKPGSMVRDEGLVFFVKFAYVEFRETRPPRAESCRRRLGRRNLNTALFLALVFLPIRLQAVGKMMRPCRQPAASLDVAYAFTRKNMFCIATQFFWQTATRCSSRCSRVEVCLKERKRNWRDRQVSRS